MHAADHELFGVKTRTIEEVAEMIGVSPQAVQQAERRAFWKLRKNCDLRRFVVDMGLVNEHVAARACDA